MRSAASSHKTLRPISFHAISFYVHVCHIGEVVRKQSETGGDRRRLAGEAAILRTAAHPGVVELVGVDNPGDPDAIVLRRVDGTTLAERSPMAPQALSWTGAAIATTVADLHDIGVVHLALEPGHVIIDQAGRPVLCGFGRSRRLGEGEELETCKQQDVAALAHMLIGAARDLSATTGAKALRSAAGGRRPPWTKRRTDARGLARAMAGTRPTSPLRRWRHKRSLAAALMLTLTGVAVASHPGAKSRPSTAAADSIRRVCPLVDDGCHAIPAAQQVLLGRFRIRGVAGSTLLGRWDCGANATPAVLDGLTGRLWVFDAWPAQGRVTTGRLVATVPGAYAPVVVPSPGSTTCDTVEISRRGGRPVVVTVRRR